MKKKIISACLAACFSLSIGAVISAETIPIRQKETLVSPSAKQMKAAPEKQPKKEKAKKKKDKKNKKENIIVNVENVKTRSGWNGVKPYTRIHTPKVVYTRKGRRNGKEALV